MKLTLSPNLICSEKQTLSFDKVATLIGENGSGKSSILQSIFETKLDKKDFDDLRIVCFSSGQNESFSQRFSKYLKKERRAGDTLSLDCFYYDKSWSKLLVFIATCLHSDGKVRTFLREKRYVEEQTITEIQQDDISSRLTIKFKVDKRYAEQVQAALKMEESGANTDTLRSTPYFRSLTSFIANNVDADYEFDNALSKKTVEISSTTLYKTSYAADRQYTRTDDEKETVKVVSNFIDDPAISFFTQAADNDYFIDKTSFQLKLKDGLELDQLSDGEYQLLFLYALIDLFDAKNTLFLLDEADSHLHYQNIEHLWNILGKLKGNVITTTHLLDSITANQFDDIKVVEEGRICEENKLRKLINRLGILSRATSVEYEVCAKIPKMALLDDYNDWDIFIGLAKRKGLDVDKLRTIQAIKKSSGLGSHSETIGESKLRWTESLSIIDSDFCTTHIFLVCDRDELKLKGINEKNGVAVNDSGHKKRIREIKWPGGKKVNVFLLAWKRREIKNYLLSFTALKHHGVLGEINSEYLALASHLKHADPCDNEHIRKLNVKDTVNPLISRTGHGICSEKLQTYIDLIPPEEISEDIENMYNFMVSNLQPLCH